MSIKPLITIYTQAYNTKSYLDQCISSVLSQTYTNFEYLLVDNGSTDGSAEIIDKFANKDSRIHVFRLKENQTGKGLRHKITKKYASGKYYTVLDSDDWWELTYLEHLVSFAETNNLDIACTGTLMHNQADGSQGLRAIETPLLLSREMLAAFFPNYHVFFRTTWAKLFRMELVHNFREDLVVPVVYGGDTLYSFQLLRQAACIGIDSSVLHHYRIHKKSISSKYNSRRFEADVCLFNDAVNFLSGFGPVSLQNRQFLYIVYANALSDTLNTVNTSSLSPAEKLKEYCRMACHPLTIEAYGQTKHPHITNSRRQLLYLSLKSGSKAAEQDNEDLIRIMKAMLPHCGKLVNCKNASLFLRDTAFFELLFQDKPTPVLEYLLLNISKKRYIKKYPLVKMLQTMVEDNLVLNQIDDNDFLQKYNKLYLRIWKKDFLAVLDEMTGLLLENQVDKGKETFLKLYLSLAAIENQMDAFLFGNLKLAQFYFSEKRMKDCNQVIVELAEMGMDSENNDELKALLQMIQKE